MIAWIDQRGVTLEDLPMLATLSRRGHTTIVAPLLEVLKRESNGLFSGHLTVTQESSVAGAISASRSEGALSLGPAGEEE